MIPLRKFKQYAALTVEINDNPNSSKSRQRFQRFMNKLAPHERETVERINDIDWLRQFTKEHPFV